MSDHLATNDQVIAALVSEVGRLTAQLRSVPKIHQTAGAAVGAEILVDALEGFENHWQHGRNKLVERGERIARLRLRYTVSAGV
ncbi:MAG: hypothetical protein LBG70_00015 [Bifidobacteriaceae bacterium]|jgi:hypothetical protein|nr:hypothetical protein [Bifidobacteriaceae bacterium]